MANPSAAAVLDLIVTGIKTGAGDVPVNPEAENWFRAMYGPKFTQHLNDTADQPNIWNAAQKNVLNAARQHGIIAAAIASLRHVKVIDPTIMQSAAGIVAGACRDTFEQGAWCA
jgi:hypothetical protein